LLGDFHKTVQKKNRKVEQKKNLVWFHLGTKGYRDGREYKIAFVFLKYIIRGF